ncbi:MAG: hypothetical protein JWN56_2970 [Sphingobacteriales bacterium]|nr:hypothetical protein [Sphingobacteriales bacterium]
MKKTFLFAALALTMSVSAFAQSVDEIVNKNITALGGKEKLNSLKSVKIDATISLQGMEVPSTVVQLNNVGIRSDFTVQGTKGTQVITKSEGWSFMPFMGQDKPVQIPAEEVKQSQSLLDLAGPLVDYAKKGNKIELAGKEVVEGKDALKLKLTLSDGSAMDYYVDPVTGYTVKTVVRKRMNGQDGEVSNVMLDYKKTEDGYFIPYTMNQIITGGPGLMVIKVTNIEINKPVDESIFEMP